MNPRIAIVAGLAALWFAAPLPAQTQPEPVPAGEKEETDAINFDEFIASLASETAPTMLYTPSWLSPSRDIDARMRPNAGIRLRPLPADRPASLLKPWSLQLSMPAAPGQRGFTSAKFQELRDLREGVGVEAHTLFGKSSFSLVGRNLGLDDADLLVGAGSPGKYLLSIGWNSTPHRYALDAPSLYGGIGTSRLTIDEAIRSDLQGSANTQDAASRISSHLELDSQRVEIGIRRSRGGVDFTLMAMQPFTVRAAIRNESRSGTRPSGASFGFSNFVELPWPVTDDTRDASFTVEYTKPNGRIYATGGVRFSSFDQHNSSLLFDNPYRITDSSAVAAVVSSTAAGPGSGQLALPPSNSYREANLSSVINRLPWQTTVSTVVSAGFMRQNEALLPFSTNSAARLTAADGTVYAATDPAALPRATAEAAMNTLTGQVRVTSRPAKRFRLVAQYRYFSLDNDEEPFVVPAFVRVDADVRKAQTAGGTFSSLPIAYNRHSANAEGSLDLPASSRLSLGYTWERTNRDFRETANMTDQRVKASLSTRTKWVDLRTSFEHSQRDTSEYRFDQSRVAQGNPNELLMLPFLRDFDEAARTRDEVQLNASRQLTESLSLSAMMTFGRDNFRESQFGMLEDLQRTWSVEAGYSAADRVSLYLSYTDEKRANFMRARAWSTASVSNPYTKETEFESNSNWDARPQDHYRTASFGFEADLIHERLLLNVAYVYSRSDGIVSFSSPVGVPGDDVNAFVPSPFTNKDDVELHSFNPELEYRFSDRWSITAGYQYEKYGIDDVNYDGFTYTPRNLAGGINAGLLMGGFLYPKYGANVLYARLKARL